MPPGAALLAALAAALAVPAPARWLRWGASASRHGGAAAAAREPPLTPSSELRRGDPDPADVAARHAEAIITMVSTDKLFVDECLGIPSSASKFALLVAARLSQVAGVPVGRFVTLTPNVLRRGSEVRQERKGIGHRHDAIHAVGCQSASTGTFESMRFSVPDNITYSCKPLMHEFSLEGTADREVVWEVVILAPTGLAGDTGYAGNVAKAIVESAHGAPDLFEMFFPGTRVVLAGEELPGHKEQAQNLGFNPGGKLEGPLKVNKTALAADVVNEAERENAQTREDLKDMFLRLGMASRTHERVMNFHPFKPYIPPPSGPLPVLSERVGSPAPANSVSWGGAVGPAPAEPPVPYVTPEPPSTPTMLPMSWP